MRGARLVGRRVVDRDGRPVGVVHDLRFRATNTENGLTGYRLDGLVCGNAGLGDRLGYTTGDVHGPWPLNKVFARLSGRAVLVPWDTIAAIDGSQVRLRVGRDQLPRMDQTGEETI